MKKLTALLLICALLLSGCGSAPESAPTVPPTEPPTEPPSTEPTVFRIELPELSETVPAPEPTEPPTEPEGPPVRMLPYLDIPVLPEIGAHRDRTPKRMFPEYTDSVPVGPNYGLLIPYLGSYRLYDDDIDDVRYFYNGLFGVEYCCKFGLCTAEGVIVTDPVYEEVSTEENGYRLRWIPQDQPGERHLPDIKESICAFDGSSYGEYDGLNSRQVGDRVIRKDHPDSDSYCLYDLNGTSLSGPYHWITPVGQYFIAYQDMEKQYTVIDRFGANVFSEDWDNIDRFGDVILLQKGDEYQLRNYAWELLRTFHSTDRCHLEGPSLIYVGSKKYTDLDGNPVELPVDYIEWQRNHYVIYKKINDIPCNYVYSKDLTFMTVFENCYDLMWLSNCTRFVAGWACDKGYYGYWVFDSETGTQAYWDDVYGAFTLDGVEHLLVGKDGWVYDAADGSRLFQGEVLEILDTPAGTYLAERRGNRLLTVDLDGNILVELPMEKG